MDAVGGLKSLTIRTFI